MKLQTLQLLQILSKTTFARSWSVFREAHIQAFTFLFDCADTLKIMVGCLMCGVVCVVVWCCIAALTFQNCSPSIIASHISKRRNM